MALAVERARAARRPFWVVDLYLDLCSLVYGVSPCTASVGGTGSAKCYNTRPTCQDSANFDNNLATPTTRIYRFCSNVADLPRKLGALPLIESVSTTPTKLSIGSGLGERGSCTVTLRDGLHDDRGVDPYVTERTYDPLTQGTFFGRLLARNKYFLGRRMVVYKGYLTTSASGAPVFDLANAEARTYFLEAAAGPQNGFVTITAKDVLKLADDDRAVAPAPAQGRLVGAIASSDTVPIAATLQPAGIGDSAYASSGKLRINNEVFTFTRTGDALSLTARAQNFTAAASHSASDAVQQCLVYTGQQLHAIVYDLLVNYAGVPATYIPLADWQTEADLYTSNRLYNTVVASPVGVNKLIGELCELGPAYFWWDELANQIIYRALRGASSASLELTDDEHFVADSVKVQTRLDLRITPAAIYFGQRDPCEALEKASNYQVAVYRVGTGGAQAKYGQDRQKIIFSRWLDAAARTFAEQVLDAYLQRYDEAPRQIDFVLTPKDAAVQTGSLFSATTKRLQGVDGAPEAVTFQTLSRGDTGQDRLAISALEERYSPDATTGSRVVTFSASNYYDTNLRTVHDQQYVAPTGPVTVVFNVLAGTIMGASSTSTPAIDVGDWPAGSDLTINVLGRVEGCGGAGGRGASRALPYVATPGSPGGTALYARFPATLDLSAGDGEIWGGGGGGGGGGSSSNISAGGSGGGGAGSLPGAGGPKAFAYDHPGKDGSPGTTELGGDGSYVPPGTHGGRGGDPGLDGSVGENDSPNPPWSNGAAGGTKGNAIDGLSFLIVVGTGDVRGTQVN